MGIRVTNKGLTDSASALAKSSSWPPWPSWRGSLRLKKPVTMRLSEDVVDYFKAMADESGVPYQSLINLYLRDCLAHSRKVQINWSHAA